MDYSSSNLKVICLETSAFDRLVSEVIQQVKKEHGVNQERWIGQEECMKLLHISSKTTLQAYRDKGKIRYSQIGRKVILYDRQSIEEFIEKNAKDTF